MSAEELAGDPGDVVDVAARVPLVATSDPLDCLRKYHDRTCGLGEVLETGQACPASRGRAGAMEAHDHRRDRRALWRLGHEVGAIGVACGHDLLLQSHGPKYRRGRPLGASLRRGPAAPAGRP